jgi:serine/threonine protein phosphatase PrpC
VLRADDGLLLFSDGITDACSPDGEAHGNVRLENALEEVREQSAAEIVSHILADNARFVSDAEKFDDITCLALRYRPGASLRLIASAKRRDKAVGWVEHLAKPITAGASNGFRCRSTHPTSLSG